MLKLSWPQIAAWRVKRHHLDQRVPAARMLALAGELCGLHAQVLPIEVDGKQAWMLTADVDEIREAYLTRSVSLIPAFDQYVIGASRHAEHLMIGGARNLIYRPQGWISPVLLVNGFMQGVWHHEVKGNRIEVVVNPFINVPRWVRAAAESEAEGLAEFLGCELNFAWGN